MSTGRAGNNYNTGEDALRYQDSVHYESETVRADLCKDLCDELIRMTVPAIRAAKIAGAIAEAIHPRNRLALKPPQVADYLRVVAASLDYVSARYAGKRSKR